VKLGKYRRIAAKNKVTFGADCAQAKHGLVTTKECYDSHMKEACKK